MLKAYSISVVICFVVLKITSNAARARAKREGRVIKKKLSFWESMQHYLALFVPIFNVLITLFLIFSFEKLYKQLIEQMAEDDRPPGGEGQ